MTVIIEHILNNGLIKQPHDSNTANRLSLPPCDRATRKAASTFLVRLKNLAKKQGGNRAAFDPFPLGVSRLGPTVKT